MTNNQKDAEWVKCPHCNGTGKNPEGITCERCGGKGKVIKG